jgi:iron complex outermembrane receptor protein
MNKGTMSLLLAGASATVLIAASPASAQSQDFNVPAQRLSTALAEFGRQAKVQIVAPGAGDVVSSPIRGTMNLETALGQMLRGTGMIVASEQNGVILIKRAKAPLSQASYAAPTDHQQVSAALPPEQPAPVPEEPAPAPIVVTGSRIPQPNLTSPSPVTAVSSEEVRLEGATRIEDVLNSLPQVTASSGSTVNGGTSGTATVDLRGLGANRTLVLIDGRRVTPGDPNAKQAGPASVSVADLNVIPDIMVKRVEVLTGGASSVYGADAVAGVVNFIMDRDYTGFTIDGQSSLFVHDNGNSAAQRYNAAAGSAYPDGDVADGATRTVQAKFGLKTPDGRGHFVAYAGYRHTSPVLASERDYSSCSLSESLATNFVCAGSATSYPGSFYNYADANAVTVGGDRVISPNVPTYNYGPQNYLQRSDRRYTAGFFSHYDISPAFKPYAEFMYMNDSTVERDAPGGDFNDAVTQKPYVNCDNPLLGDPSNADSFYNFVCKVGNLAYVQADGSLGTKVTANPVTEVNPVTGVASQVGFLLPYRRNVEGGARLLQYNHTSYRGVIGAKGEITDGISYDAYGQFGQTNYFQKINGFFQGSKINNALDVVTGTDGQPVCAAAVTGTDTSCVPYDIFTLNGVSQAAVNYLTTPTWQKGRTREIVANGSITIQGDRFGLKTPWANDGLGLNIGTEYRRESLDFSADPISESGDVAGGNGVILPMHGAFDVKEAFIEAQLPLVSDRPFVRELQIDAGYRFSHYSYSGNTSTYKAQIVWAPIRQLKIRGGYNRAVRAPSIGELFTTPSVGLATGVDPCEGTNPTFSQSQCSNLGVSASQYGHIAVNPSGSYNEISGGNTALKPEKADTYTIGLILQPVRNLNITIDAYRIKIRNDIQALGFANILNACGTIGAECDLVHRDANGTLWQTPNGYVSDIETNVGSTTTQGIDFAADYLYRTNRLGSFSLSFAGTYLDKLALNEPGVTKYDCAGLYGPICGTPQAHWRSKTRLTWVTPWNLGLSAQWRYFGPAKVDTTSSQSGLAGTAPYYPFDSKLKAYSYFDLTLTMPIDNRFTFRLGANNILDKDPPIFGSVYAPSGNGNTYSQTYDALGRYVFAGVTVSL